MDVLLGPPTPVKTRYFDACSIRMVPTVFVSLLGIDGYKQDSY